MSKLTMRLRLIRLVLVLGFVTLSTSSLAASKLRVVATTTDIAAIVRAVADNQVDLETIARGTQDPHAIEAKPSYITKMSRADLVVSNGLALEIGWLPSLIRGSRNPKINPGSSGFIELGAAIEPLEVPGAAITRAMGDVHPEGNPHFTLDPERVVKAARILADRLAQLDPTNKSKYLARAQALADETGVKLKGWQARVAKLPSKKVVTYHRSLLYFLHRFGLDQVAVLEPKPGIPPSAAHILEVIATMRKEGAKVILVDHFFDPKIAERLAQEVSGAKVQVVGVSVDARPELKTLDDVIEALIAALEKTSQ